MKPREALRVGLVGCGEIADVHIPAILKLEHVELVAVCDLDEDLARKVARRYSVGSYYTDLSELLLKGQLDLVDITAPPRTHLALSIKAMEAGCHVLVEKPMALNLDEADNMIEAAKNNRVRLGVFHSFLFLPAVIKAKSMIEKGAIGDLIGASIDHCDARDWPLIQNRDHWCHKLPGGIFGEMLPHPLYLATAFLGRLEANTVYSRKLSGYDWLAADELRVILEGENSVATIRASVNAPRSLMALDVFGTKASLHVSISSGVVIRYVGSRRKRFSDGLENIGTAYQWLAGTASGALRVALRPYGIGHHNLIEGFVESLQNDTELPVTAEEGREVTRLYQAIASQI